MSKATTPQRKARASKSKPEPAPVETPAANGEPIDPETGFRVATRESIDGAIKSLEIYNDEALLYASEKLDAMLVQAKEDRRREKKYEDQGEFHERFVASVAELLEDAEYWEAVYAHAAALAAIDSVLHEMRSKDAITARRAWKGPAMTAYVVEFAKTRIGVNINSVIEQLTAYRDERETEGKDEDLTNAVITAVWNDNPAEGKALYRQLNQVFKAVKSPKRVDSKGCIIDVKRKH